MEHKTALLIVDTQRGFIDLTKEFGSIEKAICIPGVKKVLDTVRGMSVPIYYITTRHKSDRSTLIPMHYDNNKMFCEENTDCVDIPNQLRPSSNDNIIIKRKFSSFFETDLDNQLKMKSIETIIITGLAADCCVYHTAGDAAQLGYRVIVPYKAISAADSSKYRLGMRFIETSVGKIVEIQQLIDCNLDYTSAKTVASSKAVKWYEQKYTKAQKMKQKYKKRIEKDFDAAIEWYIKNF